ncbi:MAG: polyprenyl synthetase family protein [Acidobacteriota bacterium]
MKRNLTRKRKMKVDEYIKLKREKIESALKHYLGEEDFPLKQSVSYSLLSEGKRFRPLLLIAVGEAFDGEEENLLPSSCAVEMIHTSSLIHDDLPIMDNDDWRRGKPSNHKVFGDALAMLAGDSLISLAFYIISKYPSKKGFEKKKLKAIEILSNSYGFNGLLKGQAMELNINISKESDFDEIHLKKTGSLIAASCQIGAVMAGLSENSQRKIYQFGEKLGLAFQITDDLLDLMKDEKKKNFHERNYAHLFGVDNAKQRAKALVEQAIEEIETMGCKYPPLIYLAKLTVERKN